MREKNNNNKKVRIKLKKKQHANKLHAIRFTHKRTGEMKCKQKLFKNGTRQTKPKSNKQTQWQIMGRITKNMDTKNVLFNKNLTQMRKT